MEFLSSIISIYLMISYFLASFGFGFNPAQKIQIVDEQGNPVSDVQVYYQSPKKDVSYLKLEKIGTTDKDGYVEWEHQRYGEQSIYVYTEEYQWDTSTPIGDYDVEISRTSGDTIVLEIDSEYEYTPHWFESEEDED